MGENNILATLVYYDIFDLPLKKEEIFKRLFVFDHLSSEMASKVLSESELNLGLEQLVEKGTVGVRDGYYFLFGREYLIPYRLKKEKLAISRLKRTRQAVSCLRLIPNLLAVFASGSLAMRNTDELSDLDILIVTKAGRIWLARLYVTIFLSLLGIRRKGTDKIAPNKICPNHYITDESLLIPFKSIYNAQTYSNLVPIYARDKKLIEEFKKANSWVLDYVRGWGNIDSENKILKPGFFVLLAKIKEKSLNNKLGDLLEKLARSFQFKRIASNPLTKQSGGRVVFNDRQLEFHPSSIEEDIIQKYNQHVTELGLAEFAHEKNSGLS
jgi:predicted nucleotidyltransferase